MSIGPSGCLFVVCDSVLTPGMIRWGMLLSAAPVKDPSSGEFIVRLHETFDIGAFILMNIFVHLIPPLA
jgi:hypothetical protein